MERAAGLGSDARAPTPGLPGVGEAMSSARLWEVGGRQQCRRVRYQAAAVSRAATRCVASYCRFMC
jgi:hypothetical protein